MAYTTIDKPTDYFNTKLYTGNSSTNVITGVGFQPDLVWIKDRDDTSFHTLFDLIRGATKRIFTNSTNAEDTQATSLTSFDSDGFTLGSHSGTNSNTNHVSWNWLASNTTASNTDGSITSSVSANTTAGFSIGTYTGTGSNATIGHGLGATPKLVICKRRDIAEYWVVQHADLGSGQILYLQESGAASSTGTWNNTDPTSTTFGVGTTNNINASGGTYVFYCFTEKKGFSKAFSYTGNGNSDGVYIHLGMKPAWIMVKRTDAVNQWMIIDNKRTPSNTGTVPELFADLSDVENNSTDGRFDYLSNGLKARGTNAVINASGGSYIGFAFAESPFVTSTGIPTTAR